MTLGLLPGGGGVTRTVRMLGLQAALMDVLLQGPRFKPEAARDKGLVDELVATADELLPAAKAWIAAHPDAAQNPWDRDGLQDAGRHAVDPRAGAVPPGVPGAPAQAAQGRRLPRPEGDPLRRRRGRAGRLRHREPDRVALPRRR